MKKILAVLMAAAMLMGMMAVPAFATGEEGVTPSVVSPVAGTKINGAISHTIEAVFPEGATKAELYIRDVKSSVSASIEGESVTFSNVSFVGAGFGKTEVKIVATYADTTLETSAWYTVVLMDEKAVLNKELAGGNTICAWWDTFSCSATGVSAKPDAVGYSDKFTKRELDDRAAYLTNTEELEGITFRLPAIAFSTAQTNAIITAESTIAFYNPLNLTYSLHLKNNGSFASGFGAIVSGGKFTNGTDVVAEQLYDIKVVADTVANSITLYVDNNKIEEKTNAEWTNITDMIFELNNMSGIGTGAAMAYPGGGHIGCEVRVAKPGAAISNLAYTVEDSEVSESEWAGGKLNPMASSVNVVFEEDVVADAEDVYIRLCEVDDDGEEKRIPTNDIQISGNKVIIPPRDGFKNATKYRVKIGEIALGSATYTGEDNVFIADFETGGVNFDIISPVDNAAYYNKDVVISVTSPNGAPTVTFDGATVAMDDSQAPLYTATVTFADKSLGAHDVVVKADGKEYKRTVEFSSNIYNSRYVYKSYSYDPNMVYAYDATGEYLSGDNVSACGTAQGKDGDGFVFTMTYGTADTFFQINRESWRPIQGADLYSISFDVKRLTSDASMNLEAADRTNHASTEWIYIGNKAGIITSEGKVDRSDYTLPIDELHNVEVVWECVDNGRYWIYLDGEMIHSQAQTEDGGYSFIQDIKFQVKSGSFEFGNISFGKFIVNPTLESASYKIGDDEFEANGNIISHEADKIVLNLSSAFDTVGTVLVNGVTATAEISGKKLIVTPAQLLSAGKDINIEIGADAVVSGVALGKNLVYRVKTAPLTVEIISPVNNTKYVDKDIEISVSSLNGAPTVTFDGATVTMDDSKAPIYTATVSYADKTLGVHDIVIKADGQEFKRTVELCSNINPAEFLYKYNEPHLQKVNIYYKGEWFNNPSIDCGTFEKISGKNGNEGVAFRMTKPADKTIPGEYDAWFKFVHESNGLSQAHTSAGNIYSIAFDVKRGDSAAQLAFEAYNTDGQRVWLGNPQNFIKADGTIDRSGTLLPSNEWHNLRLAWEAKNAGKYWVYLDNELVYTHDTSKDETNYNLTNINQIRFTMLLGSLDFDNLSYGKFVVNPGMESVSYNIGADEFEADGNIISHEADKIVLNLSSAFDTVGTVLVNGVAATAEVSGKKLIVTPAQLLSANKNINIEIAAGATVSGMALDKSIVYRVKTAIAFDVISPMNNTSYIGKDVTISVLSPNAVPTVTFDGVNVTINDSKAPIYTATVAHADKTLGVHEIVVEADGKEYKRNVEFYSSIMPAEFLYKYNEPHLQKVNIYYNGEWFNNPPVEDGTFEKISGKDGNEGVAFRMTKPADKTTPGENDAWFKFVHESNSLSQAHTSAGNIYSIAFDVKRGDSAAQLAFEAYNTDGQLVWLGNPRNFIKADGTIDRSGTLLPSNEWHNLRLAWEAKNAGKYWVYLDNELVYTHDTSKDETNYNLTNVNQVRFTMLLGSLDFDNLSYGKFVVNPSLESVSYTLVGSETMAENNLIAPNASKITLNLTEAFDASSVSASNVTIDGVAVSAAEVNGNKLIITPAASLAENASVSIEVGADATVLGTALGKSVVYKVNTGALYDELVSFTIEEGETGSYAKLNFTHGFASDAEKLLVSIAAYNGNQLVGIKTGWCPLEIGENEYETAELAIPDGATIKAFVRQTNMKPVAKVEK